MKKLMLLLGIILMITNHAFSQKCKVDKDPFTGAKTIVFDFGKKTILYEVNGDNIHLTIKVTYKGELNVMVAKGSDLMFKLEDEKMLTLKTISDTPPKTNVTNDAYHNVYSTYSYTMGLTKEDLAKLAASDAIILRYPDTQGGTLDLKLTGFSKKLANEIRKGAECISETLINPEASK